MKKRGPAPEPLEITKAKGSWRAKQREGEDPVEPDYGIPDAPEWLREYDEAMEHWERLTTQLDEIDVLAKTDCNALAQLCALLVQLERVTRQALIEPPTILRTTKFGDNVMPNPIIRVQAELLQKVSAYQCQFGLTPSARTGVQKLPSKKEKEGSKKDEYFKKSKTA